MLQMRWKHPHFGTSIIPEDNSMLNWSSNSWQLGFRISVEGTYSASQWTNFGNRLLARHQCNWIPWDDIQGDGSIVPVTKYHLLFPHTCRVLRAWRIMTGWAGTWWLPESAVWFVWREGGSQNVLVCALEGQFFFYEENCWREVSIYTRE